jgi:hypothetical protein
MDPVESGGCMGGAGFRLGHTRSSGSFGTTNSVGFLFSHSVTTSSRPSAISRSTRRWTLALRSLDGTSLTTPALSTMAAAWSFPRPPFRAPRLIFFPRLCASQSAWCASSAANACAKLPLAGTRTGTLWVSVMAGFSLSTDVMSTDLHSKARLPVGP